MNQIRKKHSEVKEEDGIGNGGEGGGAGREQDEKWGKNNKW